MKTASNLRRVLVTLATGAAGAVFLLLPNLAQAIGSESFQISPPTQNFSGNRGTTITSNIKVTNLTGETLTVNVGKENFVAQGEEGQVELVDNADPLYSLAPWFNYGLSQLTIPPRGTVTLPYTIGIPANAEPGGRYGSITFSTIPPVLATGTSGAAVEQTIGSLIFLRINGPANENLQMASFTTGHASANGSWTPASFFEYGPVDFLTRIKNVGNVHEKPTGNITIKNMLGLTVATLPLDSHFVIPGAIRRWSNAWPTGTSHPFMIGRYTATVNAVYAGNKQLVATLVFIVFPYKLVAIWLIIALIIFFIFWRGRKRFRRAFRILAGKE